MTESSPSAVKLRDATIQLVAEGGMQAATVRAITERAGLTQGLVRYYYGSLGGLIEACDGFVADVVREAKLRAVDDPAGAMDPLASLRDPRYPHLMGYLAHRLLENSPRVNALVDHFIDDAEGYLSAARERGVVTDRAAERPAVALMTIYALGSVVLHHQLKRLLKVDITSDQLHLEPGILTYLAANMEVFGGIFSESTKSEVAEAIDALHPQEEHP